MYAIAVVEIELETVSVATLFFFVLPLAFTLSTFLLWIMYGLQGPSLVMDRSDKGVCTDLAAFVMQVQWANSWHENKHTNYRCSENYTSYLSLRCWL
jgi:hypothetical protein